VRIALTIAGSDSGAGAGIQADLKTFAAHGVYGISAVTAVTAQNTIGVMRSAPVPSDLVTAQLEAVMSDLGAHVVDPVLVSSSGEALLDDEGMLALKRELLRRAHAVTPNIQEAEVLSGVAIRNEQDRREAARRIFALGPVHVVITGGDIPEGTWDIAPNGIVDLLYDGDVFTEYGTERVPGRHTHGTGCTFSAAVTAHLALGRSLHEAIPLAQAYVAGAIRHAPRLGSGSGPMNHFWRLDIDRAGRL